MKLFTESGICFALSTFRITGVPIVADDESRITSLSRVICEDACGLSSEGNSQSSVELLRIAGDHTGSRIDHLMTVRTYDSSQKICVVRHEALLRGITSLLRQSGYVTEEVPYGSYRKITDSIDRSSVWAVKKIDLQDYGTKGSYTSPPVVESVDWQQIYSALDGSGCSVFIQMIPSFLTVEERSAVMKKAAGLSQAREGILPNMNDSLAEIPAARWKYYAERAALPHAQVNIVVCGSHANAALAVARIRQSIRTSSFTAEELDGFHLMSRYNLPWKVASAISRKSACSMNKWTAEEVSHIFQLPCQSSYFTGVKGNPFSLVPETEFLSAGVTDPDGRSIQLGRSIYSDNEVRIPFSQLLLHTAVLGKTGARKTTLLKQMIYQLYLSGIPFLIMEPVKREYRDMTERIRSMKVFTVESPVVPFLLNPFRVPDGVTLGEYRSHLLTAFKAAFSLPDPLPALFEKAISEAYIHYGWTSASKSTDSNVTVFDMADFIRIFKRIIAESGYTGEVKGNIMSGGAFRLQSLIERCPRTFDTVNSTDVKDLLEGNVILEMGNLEPEQKSLVSALTLISILAYLKATRVSDHVLRNIIMIDEAHALLDRGEGLTEEEKALNSTMTQLMINIITEIRAYGVGVIFSDQSPSRIGSQMLDNVDNIISFRLSGKESELLGLHAGAEENLRKMLPLMSDGELIFKNRFLRDPLAVRMDTDEQLLNLRHVTDQDIAMMSRSYLQAHAADYTPYALCRHSVCRHCSVAVREEANKYAVQIFNANKSKMNAPGEIASVIVAVPEHIKKHHTDANTGACTTDIGSLSCCTAVHLLRTIGMEKGITFGDAAISQLISEMKDSINHRKGGR